MASNRCHNRSYFHLFLVPVKGPPKYYKKVLKKGDKTNYPRKGDMVACYYTGKLEDGKVFDTNDAKSEREK